MRFPGKNFARFKDTTLLTHAVTKLRELPHTKHILISTDAPNKVAQCLEAGKVDMEDLTILERPPHLCDDIATTDAVVQHVLTRQGKLDADEIVVVTQVNAPLWESGDLAFALEDFVNERRQTTVTASPIYQPNGCFYIFRVGTFMTFRRIYAGNLFLWILPFERSIDIDYPWQLPVAEAVDYGNFA